MGLLTEISGTNLNRTKQPEAALHCLWIMLGSSTSVRSQTHHLLPVHIPTVPPVTCCPPALKCLLAAFSPPSLTPNCCTGQAWPAQLTDLQDPWQCRDAGTTPSTSLPSSPRVTNLLYSTFATPMDQHMWFALVKMGNQDCAVGSPTVWPLMLQQRKGSSILVLHIHSGIFLSQLTFVLF